jgi:hypothetical protein
MMVQEREREWESVCLSVCLCLGWVLGNGMRLGCSELAGCDLLLGPISCSRLIACVCQ